MVFSSQVSASRYQYLPLRSILHTHNVHLQVQVCIQKHDFCQSGFGWLWCVRFPARTVCYQCYQPWTLWGPEETSDINLRVVYGNLLATLAEQAGPAELSPASCPLVLGLFIQQGIGCLHKLLLHLCLSESAKWGIPSSKVALIVLYILYISIYSSYSNIFKPNVRTQCWPHGSS